MSEMSVWSIRIRSQERNSEGLTSPPMTSPSVFRWKL